MQVEYGQAGKADIAELAELRLAYLHADFGDFSAENEARIAAQLPGYFERHLGEDLIGYVARDTESGRIVSVILLLVTEKPASLSFVDGWTGALLNVYTRPEARRQGIASELLQRMLADARARGIDRIDLKATKAGHGLYLKNGFVDVVSSDHTP